MMEEILAKYGFQKNKAMRSYIANPAGSVAKWYPLFKEAGAPEHLVTVYAAIMANNHLNGTNINDGRDPQTTLPCKPNSVMYQWERGDKQGAANRLAYWMTTVKQSTLNKWMACLNEIDIARRAA